LRGLDRAEPMFNLLTFFLRVLLALLSGVGSAAAVYDYYVLVWIRASKLAVLAGPASRVDRMLSIRMTWPAPFPDPADRAPSSSFALTGLRAAFFAFLACAFSDILFLMAAWKPFIVSLISYAIIVLTPNISSRISFLISSRCLSISSCSLPTASITP